MKSIKKVLALALALAMVVTAVPVTSAEAATTGVPKTKTYYAGKTYTLKLTTPKSWKSVKSTWSEKSSAVSLSSKKAKSVKVKAIKAGSATVKVKVTYKKSSKKNAKKYTKNYSCKVSVKEPSIAVKGADVVAVGSSETLTTAIKPSSAKATFTSSDATVATVDASGVVTGVKAGTATITATATVGTKTVTATKDVTVKTAILKSVAQKKATQLEATFDGDTAKIAKGDIAITNTSNNVVYPVKDITVAADKKTVTINTFSEMNDGKEYSVKYDGTEVKFTATDGTVADVGLSHTTILKGASGTEVKAQFLDKNGVVVKEFTLTEAGKEGTIDYSFTENKGYTDGDKLVLLNTGDTATAEVTYHTLKYDQTTGAETGKITKKITVTAVDDDATLSDFNYTINDKATLVNWNNEVKTNTQIAYGDKAFAFFYIKNSNGDDVTAQYKVESSDNSVLLLAKTDLTSAGDFKGSVGVSVTGVKAGNAYINVINGDGKIVKSLPVVVQDIRKLTTVKCDDITVTNSAGVLNTDSAKFEAYDQYGKKTDISSMDATIVSAPSKDTTNVKGKTANGFVSLVGTDKYSVNASSLEEGTYAVKIEASTTDSNCDKNVKVSRVVNIKVVSVDPAKDDVSFKLNVSSQKTDLAVAYGTSKADILSKKVTASVDKYIKGAKIEAGVQTEIEIKNPDGTVVGDDEVDFYITSGSAVTLANNIKTGTYKVTAKADNPKTSKEVTFSTTFTVENTQSKAIAKLDKKNQSGSTAEDILDSVMESYSYEGVKQSVMNIESVDAKENGKAIYIKTAKVDVKINDAGELLIVDCDINTSFTQ